jgi:hypothetical protein
MPSTLAQFEPLQRSWTVLVTTYRRDGSPVGTPVNLAVEGDHAYFRTYDKTGKVKRLRHHPEIELAPSTLRGRPTGDAVRGTARLLSGEEDRHARQEIGRRHPVFQRVVIPVLHKLARYRTLHYEVSFEEPGPRGTTSP